MRWKFIRKFLVVNFMKRERKKVFLKTFRKKWNQRKANALSGKAFWKGIHPVRFGEGGLNKFSYFSLVEQIFSSPKTIHTTTPEDFRQICYNEILPRSSVGHKNHLSLHQVKGEWERERAKIVHSAWRLRQERFHNLHQQIIEEETDSYNLPNLFLHKHEKLVIYRLNRNWVLHCAPCGTVCTH